MMLDALRLRKSWVRPYWRKEEKNRKGKPTPIKTLRIDTKGSLLRSEFCVFSTSTPVIDPNEFYRFCFY